MSRTIVLNQQQIEQRIRRIAFQLCEHSYGWAELYLVGIEGNGIELRNRLANELRKISKHDIKLIDLRIEKNDPLSNQPVLSMEYDLNEKHVILVDDVVNSGRTMIYAVGEMLKNPIRSLTTVALVDRAHRRFPIKVNFSGIKLTTTIQDHILVDFEEEIAFLK